VMKVVAIHDGVDSCHAGFLPWLVVAHAQEGYRLHGNSPKSWNCMTSMKWALWGRMKAFVIMEWLHTTCKMMFWKVHLLKKNS
jgi:hypothetical protein